MIQFAIAQHAPNDYRLVKHDGTTETEIDNWDHDPTLDEALAAVMDHHSVGNAPFSSRESTIDSIVLSNQWPLSKRDLQIDGETLPWQ